MADEQAAVTDAPDPLFFVPKRTANVQIKRIAQRFGTIAAEHAPLPDGVRIVFLCFTQRCGSTYLSQLISSGGVYNEPREYLNFQHVFTRSDKRRVTSFGDYFADLVKSDARAGHVFIKITPLHLGLLGEAGLLGRILKRSEFILIERGDKLAQAISFAIARTTGKYTSNMEGWKSQAEPVYDRVAIVELLNGLVESYRQFDMFFGHNGIVPVNIVYEQLVADPAASLRLISDRLGVPEFAIKQEKVRNARQANDLNESFRRRFLAGEDSSAAS